MALALLPLNQVELGFDDIVGDSPGCMQPLLDYFRSYWMTKVKISLWNVAALDVRTNNHVEGAFFSLKSLERLFLLSSRLGWNNRFNKRIGKSHPNVWSFIETLKKEEVVFEQQVLKVLAGGQRKKTKKVLALQVRLNVLSARFDNDEIDRKQYLEGLSLFVAEKK